ncbi:MAG: hypothetical protein RSF84_01770 [Ruthenibacterium sp.]
MRHFFCNSVDFAQKAFEITKSIYKTCFTTTVSKNFWTRRFPLESHQLRFYIESDHPADTVRFVADKENSGINPSLSFNGYELKRHLVNEYYIRYANGLRHSVRRICLHCSAARASSNCLIRWRQAGLWRQFIFCCQNA